MTSSSALPGFEAVPGLASPGWLWPGIPYNLSVPAADLRAGTLYAGWVPEDPAVGWQAPGAATGWLTGLPST
jgi:hypothetical protein